MVLAIFKISVAAFAILLIFLGVLLTPSPIPFGLILIAVGFALLVWAAPSLVRWLRRHWAWFDRRMGSLEGSLPEFLAAPLRRSKTTDENADQEDEDDEDSDDAGAETEAARKAAAVRIGRILRGA